MRRYRSQDELRQADLSRYRMEDMTPEERREMKRRFQEFVVSMNGGPGDKRKTNASVKKWNPLDPANGVRKVR